MSIRKRILIIGGNSQIAQALLERLDPSLYEFILTSRDQIENPALGSLVKYVDLDNTKSFDELKGETFAVCVFLAAITDTQFCEQHRDVAQRINVDNTKLLIQCLFNEKIVSRLIFLSTNQVFNGERPYPDIDDVTQGFNVYGQAKAEVENFLLTLSEDVAIVRLTKVIFERDSFFEDRVLELSEGKSVSVFNDMYLSPVNIELVISSIKCLIDAKSLKQKLYQLSGAANSSYYEILCFIAHRLGLNSQLVYSESKHAKGIRSPDFASMAFNMGEFNMHELNRGELNGYQAPSLEQACQYLVSSLKARLNTSDIAVKEQNYE